jgi:hypothetical protein
MDGVCAQVRIPSIGHVIRPPAALESGLSDRQEDLMEEEPTCGTGLAESSALPAAIARMLRAVSDVLDNHIDALDLSKEESRPEHEAYRELVERHRDIASQLQALADRMAGCRDLPMAAHDPAAMTSPESFRSFEQLVESEKELLKLLTIRAEENDAMLAEFQGAAPGES